MSEFNINQFIRKASEITAGLGKIATLAGDAGNGKTTIAYHCFPNPIFIPIERGLLSVPDAPSFQEPTATSDIVYFLDGIKAAREAGTFPYETIILDSISELETMAIREVCKQHGVTAMSDIPGFGTGYAQVSDIHRTIREKCDELVKLGLHVVAISHTTNMEEKLPDEAPYSKYALQVGRGGAKQWLNQVDAVIHVKSATQLVEKKGSGTQKHKIAQSIKNQRILDMVPKPSTMAKNRFGVSQPVTFTLEPDTGEYNNPLAPIFRFGGAKPASPEPVVQSTANTQEGTANE